MASQPVFRATHCTRYRYRYSTCRRCADVCQYNALALSEQGIAIAPSACRNCSLCVAACPTEALSCATLDRTEIVKRAPDRCAMTIACAPSGLKGDQVLPCLGNVDAAMLAHLASRGVALTLAGTEYCPVCAHGTHAARQLERHVEAVAELSSVAGGNRWAAIALPGRCDTEPVKSAQSAQRRHLFRRLVGRGVDQIAGPIAQGDAAQEPLTAIRFARKFSTAGRVALQAIFDNSDNDEQAPLALHPAIFAAQVEAPVGCTACEACARACPTDAIQVRESAVTWELAFEFSRCVGCGVCTEACQPRVLHLAPATHRWKSSPPTLLHARSKQRCNGCERFFVSPEPAARCPVCAGDDEDFASLFG